MTEIDEEFGEGFERKLQEAADAIMEQFREGLELTPREDHLFRKYSITIAATLRFMWEDMTEIRELKLFRVESRISDRPIAYWVAAFNADDALELVHKSNALQFNEERADELAEHATVTPFEEEHARMLIRVGAIGNIWFEFSRVSSPSVFACSEWR